MLIKKLKKKKIEENNFKTVLSEFYIPQIVVNNNIIGIDDEYRKHKIMSILNMKNMLYYI